jgi:transcriptional regulator with XRE-family HTH domain
MLDTHSLGEFCKAARRAAGLTLANLSARTGIPTRSLVRIEAGEAQAPIGRVMLVLQSLGHGLEAAPITRPSLESLAGLYNESADENNADAAARKR